MDASNRDILKSLSTTASIWMAAMLGLGRAPEAGIAFALVMLLLVVGARLEPAVAGFFRWPLSNENGDAPGTPKRAMTRRKVSQDSVAAPAPRQRG